MSSNLFIMSSDFIASIASIYWDSSKADRLKALRGDESMQALADRAGVSRQIVQRLEKNQASPTSTRGKPPAVARETLEAICGGLSVSLMEFLQIPEASNSKDYSKTH